VKTERNRTTIPFFGEVDVQGPLCDFRDGEKVMVGISVRNRRFSADFIHKFMSLCQQRRLEGLVVIFDEPYAWNDAADRGLALPTEEDLAHIREIGDQRTRMVQRVMRRFGDSAVALKRCWDISNSSTYREIRDEFVKGIDQSRQLFDRMVDQSRNFLITKNEVDWRRYLGFQTVEIPMLIELYYVLGYHIDIYPGDSFPFFTELENGLWEKQLPLATQYAKHTSLTFITCL
jgi:hypothetical protein